MNEPTAIQSILDGPEQAQDVLEQLKIIEENNDETTEWEFKLLIDTDDIPRLRKEITSVANGEFTDEQ